MLQFTFYYEFHMNSYITMLSCVLCYRASHRFLLVYNTNETVPGMPETKETFDWMAPIRLRRATRILQRVVRPGISQADCCCTTYYNGLGIIVITIRTACTWRCALGLGLGLGLGLEMSEIGR